MQFGVKSKGRPGQKPLFLCTGIDRKLFPFAAKQLQPKLTLSRPAEQQTENCLATEQEACTNLDSASASARHRQQSVCLITLCFILGSWMSISSSWSSPTANVAQRNRISRFAAISYATGATLRFCCGHVNAINCCLNIYISCVTGVREHNFVSKLCVHCKAHRKIRYVICKITNQHGENYFILRSKEI